MQCPTLAELPAPSSGREGWPWTEASPPVLGVNLPSITVVVPSFQQGAFLEETLRSVLLQGYPDLELLVMDGGSTDGSVEIIRRYDRWIKAWASEADGGQSAAINKGWRRAKGELVTWLNSDDLLRPGWADRMARAFVQDATLDLAYCDVDVIDGDSRSQWIYRGGAPDIEQIVVFWKTPFAQQGFLMRRRLLETCGYIDESLHFTMDTEYWLRLLVAGRRFLHVPETLGAFRVHAAAKTWTQHDTHVANMIAVTEGFYRRASPELAALAERARRRVNWNAAHVKYDNRKHADARRFALRHLRDGGVKALPRVSGMVALSVLGEPGHRVLALSRALRTKTRS
jgi:GT2 family glycosyltransferase